MVKNDSRSKRQKRMTCDKILVHLKKFAHNNGCKHQHWSAQQK